MVASTAIFGRSRGFSSHPHPLKLPSLRLRRGRDRSDSPPRTGPSACPVPRWPAPDRAAWKAMAPGLRRFRNCRRSTLSQSAIPGPPTRTTISLCLPEVSPGISTHAATATCLGLSRLLSGIQSRALSRILQTQARQARLSPKCRPALVSTANLLTANDTLETACFRGLAGGKRVDAGRNGLASSHHHFAAGPDAQSDRGGLQTTHRSESTPSPLRRKDRSASS